MPSTEFKNVLDNPNSNLAVVKFRICCTGLSTLIEASFAFSRLFASVFVYVSVLVYTSLLFALGTSAKVWSASARSNLVLISVLLKVCVMGYIKDSASVVSVRKLTMLVSTADFVYTSAVFALAASAVFWAVSARANLVSISVVLRVASFEYTSEVFALAASAVS